MNSNLIRERLNRNTKPFVFRLSDGTRVHAAHPAFVAVWPGQIVVINPGTEGMEQLDPLPVVAIEASPPRKLKANGKRSR